MTNNGDGKRWLWPAAFFILNLAAIVVWFAWYSNRAAKELAVSAMTPSGAEVDAKSVSEIVIDFNLPLDPETVKPDTIRLVPPVGGKTELSGPHALRFLPREPLSPATGYTAVLSPGIRGTRGEAPPRELLEFSTTRFKLENAAQAGFERYSHTVELEFNQPIAASELERSITVKASYPDSADRKLLSVVGNDNSRRQRLRIDSYRSGLVLITLPAGLTGSSGPLGLENDEKLLWRIVNPSDDDDSNAPTPEWAAGLTPINLKQEVAFLGMSSDWDNEDATGVVRVRTTVPLDVAAANKHVKIEPDIPVTYAPGWNGMKILGPFQPGKQYRITLTKGMPAGKSGELTKDVSRPVWFDDLPELLAFTYGGGFLSPDGLLKVSVRTRNVPDFSLGMRKLYASNIVEALLRDYDEEIAEQYAEHEIVKKIQTGGVRNQEKEVLLDLVELAGEKRPLGVYGLEIWREGRRWHSKNALVAISDLGLSFRIGNGEAFAWATSIREGTPRAGVTVKLYSNKRQLLAEGVTGDDGVARMAVPPLPEGDRAALLIGEAEKGESSFVRLDKDMKARPAETRRGVPYTDTYQVFLTADRGVYRGGESVMLAGLVRDRKVETVPDLPLDIVLLGPDGRQLRQSRATADAYGRLEMETPLGQNFAGGMYTVEARLPGQKRTLGQVMFRIADYMPETLSIAMELKEKKKEEDDGDNTLWIKVSRLAGGEMGKIPVRVLADYRAAPFTPQGWDGWTFGDGRRTGSANRRERDFHTAPDGTGAVKWKNPDLPFPAAAIMTVRAEASENEGRPVGGTVTRIVHDTPHYIGMDISRRRASANQPFPLPLAAVRPDGTLEELGSDWSGQLLRIEYTGLMKRNSEGRLVYEWVRREIPEAKLSGIWKKGRSEARPIPLAGGSYKIIIDSETGRGCTAEFTVEGSGGAWHGEDPETLAVTLDRDKYAVGDRATASTLAPFAGIALITVETDVVLSHWIMEFKQGENSFVIPVSEDMRPNAFVSALLVRPAHTEAEWKPHRLSGTTRLAIDNHDRRLAVDLTTDETFAPGKTATVKIAVADNGKPVANAPVELWAVDVGLLSLTGYTLPSPWDKFYQARSVGVLEADMYSRLAPELAEWLAVREAAPGGDGANELSRRFNPIFATRIKPAVIHTADVITNDMGETEVRLPVPQFAGRVRLMCWAGNGPLLGASEKEIEVKAPVSITAAWPRFAAPGDEFDVPVTVLNRSGRKATAMLVSAGNDALAFDVKSVAVELEDNQTKHLTIGVKALRAGLANASITATLDDDSFTDRVEMSIRPPVLFARLSGAMEVPAGGKSEFVLAEQLLSENSRVKLLAGGSPQIFLSGTLEYLLDYPYGCAEQTASRLLALAALPDLLALSRPGQLESGELGLLATACIERLSSMQTANGALKMWPNASAELFWVSAQGLFSLCETKASGHEVPARLMDSLGRYLDSRLDDILDDKEFVADSGESAALAVLALAKADKLKRSWLLRLEEIADAHAKQCMPMASSALAFMCESVALASDRETALALYNRYSPSGETPGKAGNKVIDLSAWLMAAMAIGHEDRHVLAAELGEMSRESFSQWSTRENSLALVALSRYWQNRSAAPEATATATINKSVKKFSTRRGGAWDKLPAGAKVEIANPSKASLRLFWVAEGVPLSGTAPEEDKGLIARRRVFDTQGNEIAAPYTLTRGAVYEIRLTVEGKADDLVMVDMLPAGLEIEDASLKGRPLDGDAAKGLTVSNVEIKDDRLLVFASVDGSGEYRYLVRAVTSGGFAWPAFDASRMYDARSHSVNGSGRLKIAGGKEAANDR